MDFDLSDDQRMLQDTLRRYFANDFPLSKVREVFDRGGELNEDLWRAIGDLGLLGVLISSEHGGMGLDLLDAAVSAEMLGYAAAPGPFIENLLAALAIARGGTPQQQEREAAANAGRRAVEFHGGVGYTSEADVHFLLKRTIFDRAYLETPRAMRERVAELNAWPVAG